MQVKLIRRPMLAAGIAIAADILILAVAAVLNAVRSQVPAEYYFTVERRITASHPFEYFGIVAAVVIVIAAAMSALILINALTNSAESKKTAPRVAGAVTLLIFSAAAALVSWLIVSGQKPIDEKYYYFTNDELYIVMQEEKYSDSYGVLKLFSTPESEGEATLLASTDISSFGENEEHYTLEWLSETAIGVRFADGLKYRSLQIPIE